MLKKYLWLLGFLYLQSNISFAQLSGRENDSTTVLLGARPVKGDKALTFGVNILRDTANGIAPLDVANSLRRGDLLTFRYYLTDQVVFRGGLRFSKDLSKKEGFLADSTQVLNPTNPSAPNWIESSKNITSRKEHIVAFGLEKHFSKKSIFDVYIGGDLLLGRGKEEFTRNTVFTNEDYYKYNARTRNTVIGLGGVTGFNIFIAHLPISVGLEYGLNAKWIWNGKTRVKESIRTTTGTTVVTEDIEYFILSDDPAGLNPAGNPYKYSNARSRQFQMDSNQNVRLVLNIYF